MLRDLPAPFSGQDVLSITWSQAMKVRQNQELLLRVEQQVL